MAQRTRLYDSHMALDGRMVTFAGWELPVQYAPGPLAEHAAVRNAAGLFDIDHMGQFRVAGPDSQAYLQHVQTCDVAGIEVWHAHYGLLLYADSTIVDDIFLYRQPDHWMVVVNASNRVKDLAWMQAHTGGFRVSVEDISDQTYMVALQGPRAVEILQPLVSADLDKMAARTCQRMALNGTDTLVGRTGYTGEDGFELYFPAERAHSIWQRLLADGRDQGLLPCGLAARDSLRFEACMPLYGHEIDAATNPLEARLGWVVDFGKDDFVGRNVLLKVKLEKPQRLLIGFEMMDKGVARQGFQILVDGQVVGHVTTGMKSPTLGRFLGMGYVPSAFSKIGTKIDIKIRDTLRPALVVKRPFYQPRYVD